MRHDVYTDPKRLAELVRELEEVETQCPLCQQVANVVRDRIASVHSQQKAARRQRTKGERGRL
jgi:hypothetical protein